MAFCLAMGRPNGPMQTVCAPLRAASIDRKSTRLNSSHGLISYAVFCLKKTNNTLTNADPKVQLGTVSEPPPVHTATLPLQTQKPPAHPELSATAILAIPRNHHPTDPTP